MAIIDVDRIAIPAFSVEVKASGTLRYDGFNAHAEAISGLSRSSLVGKTPHEALPPEMADFVHANYRRCVDTVALQEYEEQLDLPIGQLWLQTTLSPVVDTDGRVAQVLGTTRDITSRKLADDELRSAAFKDPLTGICNRRRFQRELENAVARATDTGRPFSVIFADVDRFKAVNDTHGHNAGDAVLKAIAVRLTRSIRETDRLARIGGDEFAAIVSASSEGAIAVALDRMYRNLAGPIQANGRDLIVGVSLGAALWRPKMTTTEITAAADAAMYHEKTTRAA